MIDQLKERAGNQCELCGAKENLVTFTVEPGNSTKLEENVLICATCESQINKKSELDAGHWRVLNDSMWSEVLPVQILSWRMLNRLKMSGDSSAADLVDMMYLDDENLKWARATGEDREQEEKAKHLDSNGVELATGDNVVLIKDLDVKGAGFTAKRGTAVRIRLVSDDPTMIEAKVNGQNIYILTEYVKK
ncbi:MAG: PhnA domain-containing protein [Bacteroidota bacterium]